MPNNCETARFTLSTDEHGRDWEHFWIGDQYKFSNQIPNRMSFTTTDPGKVIGDRGLCYWSAQPSAPPNAAQSAPAMAPGEGGAMGLLLLLGIVGSGVYAWYTKVKPDWSDDYHPMADVPPLPTVYMQSPASATPATGAAAIPALADDSPLPTELSSAVIDRHRLSHPSDAGAFSVPWDEPMTDVIDRHRPVIDPSSDVIDDAVTGFDDGSPYGLDKLKGVPLKQFKDQLASQGITADSGSFKTVEMLQYQATTVIVERRMLNFWKEFGSTRIPHAIYFLFGLQDGGNRSPEFKEQYEAARLWVTNWFKENLAHE